MSITPNTVNSPISGLQNCTSLHESFDSAIPQNDSGRPLHDTMQLTARAQPLAHAGREMPAGVQLVQSRLASPPAPCPALE